MKTVYTVFLLVIVRQRAMCRSDPAGDVFGAMLQFHHLKRSHVQATITHLDHPDTLR